MKKIAIIGSGDLGQLIAWHASQLGFEVIGYFDDYKSVEVTLPDGYPVIGSLDQIGLLYENKVFDELMIGVGYNHMEFRESLFELYKNEIPFANIIHPSVSIEPSLILGKGVFILPGVVLDHNVEIGNNVLLNTGCIIAHDSSVASHSFLSPAVKVAGFVKIASKCIIGINTTVIDNIEICSGTQTGGGTVVIKNLNKRGLYVGNPARLVREF